MVQRWHTNHTDQTKQVHDQLVEYLNNNEECKQHLLSRLYYDTVVETILGDHWKMDLDLGHYARLLAAIEQYEETNNE
jgi:hypothetical protein